MYLYRNDLRSCEPGSRIGLSDHEADLENPDVWESTMRDVELTGVWALAASGWIR